MMRRCLRAVIGIIVLLGLASAARAQTEVHVVIDTELGEIELVVDTARAPVTAANFLHYVDEGLYDGGRFHRAVRLDNQVRRDVLIEVIQGSRSPERAKERPGFGPIPLEPTSMTGLRHLDGAISMARNGAATAVSDFFICIGDQPSLDEGGARNPDGLGFAVFGRVVRGMDVVGRIQAGRTNDREQLLVAVAIHRIARR